MGTRAYINTGHGQQLGHSLQEPGQDGRGGEDVPTRTARIREGMGTRAYINTRHGQQLGHPLRGPGQARRGGEDVPTRTARIRERTRSRTHEDRYSRVKYNA